jgi:hypothetical protein
LIRLAVILLLALVDGASPAAAIEIETYVVGPGVEIEGLSSGAQLGFLTNTADLTAKFRLKCRWQDGTTSVSEKVVVSPGRRQVGILKPRQASLTYPRCTAVQVRYQNPDPDYMGLFPGLTVQGARLVAKDEKSFEVLATVLNHNQPGINFPWSGRVFCVARQQGIRRMLLIGDRISLPRGESRDVKLSPEIKKEWLPVSGLACDVMGVMSEGIVVR